MRFIKHPPVPGTKKIVKKFLWWPLSINNETHWFKTVTIQYEYVKYGVFYDNNDKIELCAEWKPIKFIK